MDKSLQSWIDGFPYDKAREELADLETQKSQIDARVADLTEMIALYERHRPARAPALTVEMNGTGPKPGTHANAVLSILEAAPGRSYTLRSLSDEFYKRGWFRPEVRNGREIMRGVMRKLVVDNPNVRQVADNPISYMYRLRSDSGR